MTIKNVSINELNHQERESLRPVRNSKNIQKTERYLKNAIRSNNPHFLAALTDDELDEDEYGSV